MENNEKRSVDTAENLNDAVLENAGGGANITYLVCCTCGQEIELKGPMMGQYYNRNICPKCSGRLKTW